MKNEFSLKDYVASPIVYENSYAESKGATIIDWKKEIQNISRYYEEPLEVKNKINSVWLEYKYPLPFDKRKKTNLAHLSMI